jgi:hypothetical protein
MIGLVVFVVPYIKKTQKIKILEIQLAEKENNKVFKIGKNGTIIGVDKSSSGTNKVAWQ